MDMSAIAWLLLALGCGQAAAPPATAPADPLVSARAAAPLARYHGVLIRVPDLELALAFYSGVLGFESERIAPSLARLEDRNPIYLEQVGYPLRPPEGNEARASVAFQTRDIRAAITRLRERGVAFLSEEPSAVGVGQAIRFRDPFGNIHSLLEHTVSEVPPFDEPEVYNSGFKHPDADTASLRALIVDRLGFTVRTERYFPPSLPIGHRDGTFAFMLHENEPWEVEVRPRADPASAAVSLIFATTDLPALRRALSGPAGIASPGEAQAFALGVRSRMIFPSGVPVEYWRFERGR